MNSDITIPAVPREEDLTLPMICMDSTIQYEHPRFLKGRRAGDYILRAPMRISLTSEIWYGEDPFGMACVIKFSKNPVEHELLVKIRSKNSPYLARILDMGEMDGMCYEVYPYYRQGNPDGLVEEDVLKETVLPSLIKALNVLHGEGIAHNDIKPSNLFWDDERKNIILGDFGCISRLGENPVGYTPSYSAPEILMGGPGRRSSDWCSVGLTLASMYLGEKVIKGQNIHTILHIWENEFHFQCDSRDFQQLVNGMIQMNPKKRFGPKAAQHWCNGGKIGGESRQTNIQEKKRQYITIEFDDPKMVAADISTLLDAIESHWDHSAFLFHQKRFDRFLQQFGEQWNGICKKIRMNPVDEVALFLLTLELTDGKFFIWRGKRFQTLLDMESEWERGREGAENVLTFLQRGMVTQYLGRMGAQKEQIDYVKSLQASSHYNPENSCFQLFQALKGDDGFEWKENVFHSLSDLADWLEENVYDIDQQVDELVHNQRFEAWIDYQGLEGVLAQIRKRCEYE